MLSGKLLSNLQHSDYSLSTVLLFPTLHLHQVLIQIVSFTAAQLTQTTAESSDIITAAVMNTGRSSFVSTDRPTAASETSVVTVGLGCVSAFVVTTAASSSGGAIVDKAGELPGSGAESYATWARQ